MYAKKEYLTDLKDADKASKAESNLYLQAIYRKINNLAKNICDDNSSRLSYITCDLYALCKKYNISNDEIGTV
jgi:hypothetical protein